MCINVNVREMVRTTAHSCQNSLKDLFKVNPADVIRYIFSLDSRIGKDGGLDEIIYMALLDFR